MWGAAANLSPRTTRYLAIYFSTLPPKSPTMEIRNSQPQEEPYMNTEIRISILCPALFVMARMLRALDKFLVWEDCRTTI